MAESEAAAGQVVDGADDPLAAFVDWYLSAEHRDDPGSGCASSRSATDVPRPNVVRSAYTGQVERYLVLLDELLGSTLTNGRQRTRPRRSQRWPARCSSPARSTTRSCQIRSCGTRARSTEGLRGTNLIEHASTGVRGPVDACSTRMRARIGQHSDDRTFPRERGDAPNPPAALVAVVDVTADVPFGRALMIVRDATQDDVAACAAIYAPNVSETAISFEADAADQNGDGAADRRGAGEARVAGAGRGRRPRRRLRRRRPAQPRAAYRWSCEVSVYADRDHCCAGAGRARYQALLARLARRGYRMAVAGMTLPIDASAGFHRAMGFEPVGTYRRIGYKFGAWHDVARMQRAIGDPRAARGAVLSSLPRPVSVIDDLVANNERLAAGVPVRDLDIRPRRQPAIVTCMDSGWTCSRRRAGRRRGARAAQRRRCHHQTT